MDIEPRIKLKLKEEISKGVHNLEITDEDIPIEVRNDIKKLIKKHEIIFGSLNYQELIDTNIKAEIKTITNEPIYTKSYPFRSICGMRLKTKLKHYLRME